VLKIKDPQAGMIRLLLQEKLVVVAPVIILLALVAVAATCVPKEPTTEDRVKVLEAQVQKLQEEVKQQEELREEAVFGLWEVINVTEQRCEQCLHECGGID
jgi:hypothetical protein